MSPQEQALLEARAIMLAHLQVFANLASPTNEPWPDGRDLLNQITKLKAATEAYAKLPRPEMQKAA